MVISGYRKYFPVTEKYTYLDNSGVAPVSTIVSDRIDQFLKEATGSGVYAYDGWMEQIEEVRKLCSRLAGCKPGEIAFVRSTSHGISLVASGYSWNKDNNVVIYEKEFPSNVYPWLGLQSKGVEVKRVQPDADGFLDINDIKKAADTNTRIISVSSVQFTNGYRVDLNELGEFCKENRILLFVDAIQSMGVVPMDVKRDNIDFLAADGHKWLLSPEGTGFFYCRDDLVEKINPPLLGWKSVVNDTSYENIDFSLKKTADRFEEGSFNVMGILALGASIRMLLDIGIDNINKRVYSLGDLVIKNCDSRGFEVTSPRDKEHRGGVVCFRFDRDLVKLREELIEEGVMVNLRGGALRVSPHFYNNEQDIENLFKTIDKILDKKGLS